MHVLCKRYTLTIAYFIHRTLLTVFLFGVRGFATGFFQAIYLYTPEVRMYIRMYLHTLVTKSS